MTDSDQRYEEGIEALGRADFPAAIDILSRVATDDPSNGAAWRALGICYLEIREPKTALQALERSLEADSADADTHYVLGSACGTLGDLERAAACYRRALEIRPDHAKAEEFLIRTEALLESRDHYRRGLKLLYSSEPSRDDLNQAVRELVQSAAIFGDSPARESLADCAQRLLAMRREQPAGVETTPAGAEWVRACERRYQCLIRSNWVGARAAFEDALQYRGHEAFVHHALGFSFVLLGETDQAVRAWLRVLELDPAYDFSCFVRVGA